MKNVQSKRENMSLDIVKSTASAKLSSIEHLESEDHLGNTHDNTVPPHPSKLILRNIRRKADVSNTYKMSQELNHPGHDSHLIDSKLETHDTQSISSSVVSRVQPNQSMVRTSYSSQYDAVHSTEDSRSLKEFDIHRSPFHQLSDSETPQSFGDRDDCFYITNSLPDFDDTPSRFLRLRRSVFTDAGYGSRLQAGSNIATSSAVLNRIYGKFGPGKRSGHFSEQLKDDRLNALQTIQRILLNCVGSGARLPTVKDITYSNNRDDGFGMLRPGKRSVELTDFDMLNGDNTIRNKRLSTDYGYGSRLQAGSNVAKNLDRSGLYGIMGPGKRSYSKLDLAKRIAIDLGYGSRAQAAENVATSSNEDLFGTYGPGK